MERGLNFGAVLILSFHSAVLDPFDIATRSIRRPKHGITRPSGLLATTVHRAAELERDQAPSRVARGLLLWDGEAGVRGWRFRHRLVECRDLVSETALLSGGG